MATSRRVGNYASSANAVIRNSDAIFDAAMSGKPDFTAISKEAIKGRGLERRAVIEAEGNVAKAGLEAFTKAKRTRNAADTAKEINDIKRPARRMAGVVAGLGAISGAALMHKNLKDDRAERAELKALDQQNFETKMGILQGEQEATREMIETMKATIKNTSLPSTNTPPKSSGSGTNTSGSTSISSSNTPAEVKPTSTKGLRGDVYNYLTQHHKLSNNKALGLMANIDRESSFQINPQGGDGGNSFGMFQWNNTYGRSQRMKENVGDWQTNWKGQIDYALGGSQLPEYNTVTSDFKSTKFQTPQEAADYWMQHWERPAHQERDSKRHTEILGGYNF